MTTRERDFSGTSLNAATEVAAAFGISAEQASQWISDAIGEIIERRRRAENIEFLEEIARQAAHVSPWEPSRNGITPLQRRGRNVPDKRPFMQIVHIAGGRDCRVYLKDFIRYGRA